MADEVAHLVEIAKKELALGGDMQSIGAFAVDDYQRYAAEADVLRQFVDLLAPGESVPTPEAWHKEFELVGDARKILCNNAAVALKAKVEEAKQRLNAEQAQLNRVIAALEDVKQAHDSAEEAAELTSTLLEIKTVVDVIRNPEKLYEELKHKITGSKGGIIQAGIRDLGQYYELVTLASHGFASFEELANYTAASMQNVVHAGEAFQDVYAPYLIAQRDYDIPVP